MLWKLTRPPSNTWPGKILEGISLQIETDSNCSQISEYYCLRKDFRYSVFVYTHCHHSHIQENTGASWTWYAPSSSLGVYPGLSLKGWSLYLFYVENLSLKNKADNIIPVQKNTQVQKNKVIKISCHSPSPSRDIFQYPCTSTQLQVGKMWVMVFNHSQQPRAQWTLCSCPCPTGAGACS